MARRLSQVKVLGSAEVSHDVRFRLAYRTCRRTSSTGGLEIMLVDAEQKKGMQAHWACMPLIF
jgi:hypothetical protein